MVFDCPSSEVKLDYFSHWKLLLIEHVCQKHRNSSIGTCQFDDSELNEFSLFSLLAPQSPKVIAGRVNDDEVLLSGAVDEVVHCRKRGFSGAAKQEMAFVVFPEVVNELVAGISSIEKQHVAGGNGRQECLGLFPFATMDAIHAPGNGKPSENVIGCGNQTVGIVAFAFMLKTALRIKLFADLLRGGKRVDRTIEGINRHPMPKVGMMPRPETVSQAHSPTKNIPENSPMHLLSSPGDSTAVNYFGATPESTALSTFEELARLDVHPLALSAGAKGENEDDQPGEGEFAVPCKVICRLFGQRIDTFGNQI